ncbi:hypothetical protein [Haladaptatus sp. DYF46]|uniref:hypothetical protein n=1 Tax=Haladaptatus sp. DYF46 TaxID=2886041 RepID=UPI001E4A1790|nr:hypothetical protein [Haladaptatus sp. DYF46]
MLGYGGDNRINPTEQLARSLLSESKAYGYTLTIWGGGAILMNQYGSPRIVEIFLYILGYGILAALNPGFPANWGFLLIGFWGTLSYNLLLLLESGFARFVTSTFDTVEVGS